MRRARPIALVPIALVTTVLALSSCGTAAPGATTGDTSASPTPSVSAHSDGPLPEVSGAFGERPSLTFPDGIPSDSLQVSVLSAGGGRTVEAGDFLGVDVLGQVWAGDVLQSTFDGTMPMTFQIGTGAVIPGWDQALVGQPVGSRVLVTVPPSLAYGENGYPDGGIPGSVTLAFVFDILGAYPADAGGDPDATPTAEAANVVPVVQGELGGTASISVPDGAPEPTEPSTTVLAESTGAPVQAGELVAQYTWISWDNTPGQSTWVTGSPAVLKVEPGGPFDGLTGVPLGSRVLVVVPATQDRPAAAIVVDLIGQLSTAA